LRAIVEAVPTVIVEHHALRDEHWRLNAQPIYSAATRTGHKVLTAAEYAGLPNVFLESRRRQLFQENPPSEEFKKWMRLGGEQQSRIKPPI
jgi:predicted metallo-beta-lactamase superfamily hydrolase